MKILFNESVESKTIMSYSEQVEEMLNTLETGIADMKQSNGFYDSSIFVCKLINFRNGIDDLIDDLAFNCI